MKDFFNNIFGKLPELWKNWGITQKVVFIVVLSGTLLGTVLLVTFSASTDLVPIVATPINDEELRSKIAFRLEQEAIPYSIASDNRIMVADQLTSRRVVAILARENLLPDEASPWDVFQLDSWTVTDLVRNVQVRAAITTSMENHIVALNDVDSAEVILVMPETETFAEDQDPVTASISITPRPGSDILTNRLKLEGIQRLVKLGVQGLVDENIVITDNAGRILNNFGDRTEFDRLELIKRQLGEKTRLEAQYRRELEASLTRVFADKAQITRIEIDLDMGQRSVSSDEVIPVVMAEDNPQTPANERRVVENVPLSTEEQETTWTGSGINPEGPPGVAGQTPPEYNDMQEFVGQYSKTINTTNYELSRKQTEEQSNPYRIQRVSIGVALDGDWQKVYDETGTPVVTLDGGYEREYTPPPTDRIDTALTLVQAAVGFDQARGDQVTVAHLQFDRADEFALEDAELQAAARRQLMIIIGAAVILGVGVIAIIIRMILKELERRRILKEEELARQREAMREAALAEAEEESVEMDISVEERARQEMLDSARQMAQENPENVAMLIRTWLAED